MTLQKGTETVLGHINHYKTLKSKYRQLKKALNHAIGHQAEELEMQLQEVDLELSAYEPD